MLKFVLKSYSFRKILILFLIFSGILLISSYLFDKLWLSTSSIPIINLNDVYNPPVDYDNFTKVNLKMINNDLLAIEGNKKFRISGHQSGFEYYDTLMIYYPDTDFDKINKIFILFEDSREPDSIYIVTAKSPEPKIYFNQIFYSSIIVYKINEFSNDAERFRIKNERLTSPQLLANNDTLITQVFNEFNSNIENLGLADCGTNSRILSEICKRFDVPCRVVNLQGGDVDQTGYADHIGYPLHVVCEIYSSKFRKWYVVDPSFGFRFRLRENSDFLNAAEISNRYTFRSVDEILQDSILLTKRSLVGKDYFKYYENVIFTKLEWKNKYVVKLVSVFYGNFNYFLYLYSNNYPPVKNGFYYLGLKTIMYIFIIILFINSVMFVLIKRLFSVKKPNHQ